MDKTKLIQDLSECLEDSLEDADLWYSECDTDVIYANASNAHQNIKTRSRKTLKEVDTMMQEEYRGQMKNTIDNT